MQNELISNQRSKITKLAPGSTWSAALLCFFGWRWLADWWCTTHPPVDLNKRRSPPGRHPPPSENSDALLLFLLLQAGEIAAFWSGALLAFDCCQQVRDTKDLEKKTRMELLGVQLLLLLLLLEDSSCLYVRSSNGPTFTLWCVLARREFQAWLIYYVLVLSGYTFGKFFRKYFGAFFFFCDWKVCKA